MRPTVGVTAVQSETELVGSPQLLLYVRYSVSVALTETAGTMSNRSGSGPTVVWATAVPAMSWALSRIQVSWPTNWSAVLKSAHEMATTFELKPSFGWSPRIVLETRTW